MPIDSGDAGYRGKAVEPRRGYERIAEAYEKWHWYQFWERNEAPIVKGFLAGRSAGVVLDAGGGTGPYRAELEARGHRYVGVDISLEMLRIQQERARAAIQGKADRVVQADVCALPFGNSVFDTLVCTRVLSHVRWLGEVLMEFTRVGKRNAEIIISDVHPNHPYKHMRVAVGLARVAIRTYKHGIETLRKEILRNDQLVLVELKEYGLRDLLWKPPGEQFGKIYKHPDRPVFYVCRLRKTQ